MPKSEFNPELNIRGGFVHGEGPFHGDPPTARGGSTTRSVICWMLDQDGVLAFNAEEHHGGDHWHVDAPADPALQPGRARAIGVVLSLDGDGAQAFTWSQEVTLTRE